MIIMNYQELEQEKEGMNECKMNSECIKCSSSTI